MGSFLSDSYVWMRALHVMAVISWMAGLFYLPRLFVYQVERAAPGSETEETLQIMQRKLLRGIMYPAMIASWLFGLALVFTPGVVAWGMLWPWSKGAGVLAMSWFHFWLAARRKELLAGTNRLSGRHYRMMNELPTLLMVIIVISVMVKF